MKKLLFLFLLLSSLVKGQNLDSTYVTGVVAAVHDGESFKIRFANDTIWIRLNFVDCPEIQSNHICAAQEDGKMIGDLVRSELKGQTVKVKFMGTDIYNRPLVRI